MHNANQGTPLRAGGSRTALGDAITNLFRANHNVPANGRSTLEVV
jgi:hypothetical protein